MVIDLKYCYYLATEELSCKECGKPFQSWDQHILNQLTESRLAQFPAILTRKCACDKAVVSLLRGRTLGNSSNALRNALLELHSEEWMQKQHRYLEDCRWYWEGMVGLRLAETPPVLRSL